MAITKSGTRITVKYEAGDVYGYDSAHPFRMSNIKDAFPDFITEYNTGRGITYILTVSIYIEGANTYFEIDDESLIWDGAIDYDDISVFCASEGHIYIHGSHGSIIIAAYKRIYLFSENMNVNNYVFSDMYVSGFGGGTWDNIIIQNASNHTLIYADTESMTNIRIYAGLGFISNNDITILKNWTYYKCTRGIWYDRLAGDKIFRNLKLIECLKDITFRPAAYDGDTITLIDCQIDLNNSYLYTIWDGDAYALNKTTFNAYIENGNGGTLIIEDSEGNVLHTEILSSDNMTEHELTYQQLYVDSAGEGTKTFIEYTPLKLKVIKGNYQDLEIPDITVQAGVPTNVFGKMELKQYVTAEITGQVETAEVSGSIETVEISGSID